MAKIVAVHGVGQQLKGENSLRAEWLPALRDGLSRIGAELPNDGDFVCPFYGDLFRKQGKKAGDPLYDASDLSEDWEIELLEQWWREAATVDPAMLPPDLRTKRRTPKSVQRALDALSNSKFWAGVAEHLMIFDIKQARSYLNDDAIRRAILDRVIKQISADTKVLIGHSLGSIVAYEALCEHPEWQISTLVTLGSPLGIRNLIFDKLRPAPRLDRTLQPPGEWPTGVKRWTNIADAGDIAALVKDLNPLFGHPLEDKRVDNGATAHYVQPYLTAKETGEAIAVGLAD